VVFDIQSLSTEIAQSSSIHGTTYYNIISYSLVRVLFKNVVSNTEITGTETKITVYCRLVGLIKIFVVYFKTRPSMGSSYKYFRLQIRVGNTVNISEHNRIYTSTMPSIFIFHSTI
jgi:hypothetical protein